MDRGERVSFRRASRAGRVRQHTVFASVYSNVVSRNPRFDGRCSPLVGYLRDITPNGNICHACGNCLARVTQNLSQRAQGRTGSLGRTIIVVRISAGKS